MDKLVVLAYDLAAVLIILMTIAYSAQLDLPPELSV